MPRAYIGIGSNLDDPRAQVLRAIDALAAFGTLEARSSIYRTAPWGETRQPDFMNAVVALQTRFDPLSLFRELKALERRFGRVETERRWGPRLLDLDVLLYAGVTKNTPDLTIPHPRLFERAFVLVPLAEIDDSYAVARDALSPEQLKSVTKL
ncbi:MAG: 2-amino-4-hydroxy-6-hydroxymethyldihydropteridine diphosphokinase [Candidatus Baltobacteraceae bacterium]